VKFIQLYLGCLILTFLVLDLSNKTLFLPINFYVGSYMMFLKILIGFFRNSYDTMLFQIRFFHFGITTCHSLQMGLETIQIIVNLPIELVNAPKFLYGLNCESKDVNSGRRNSWARSLARSILTVKGRARALGWDSDEQQVS